MEAAEHIKSARCQRDFLDIKKEECVKSVDLPKEERALTLEGDYCQNMGLPNQGEEQPGDTCHTSPANVRTFGFADCSYRPIPLAA